MKNKLKTTLIILAIIVSCLSVGVYAATVLSATDVNYTKSDGTTVNVKAALDELYTKVPVTRGVGDEVTVGGEQFYILEWNSNSDVALLMTKYNLNKAGTAQLDSSASDTDCIFANSRYWGSVDWGETKDINNISGYASTDAMGKAKSYGQSKGAVSSRLLSFEEAKSLESRAPTEFKIAVMLWGRASYKNGYLNYWLGRATRTGKRIPGFTGNGLRFRMILLLGPVIMKRGYALYWKS